MYTVLVLVFLSYIFFLYPERNETKRNKTKRKKSY